MSDGITKALPKEKLAKLLNFLDNELCELTYLDVGCGLVVYFLYLYRTLLIEKYKYDELMAERMVDMLIVRLENNFVASYEATVAANVSKDKLN